MKYTGLIRYHILNQFPAFTDSVGNKWGALDIIDGAIIDWILDFFPRAKKETKDGVVYMFVSNSYLITDMPVLGIRSDRAIRARVERMVAHGVLVRWHKDKTEQYLAVTKRWADKEWQGRNETSEGSERNFRGGRNETSDNPPTSYPPSKSNDIGSAKADKREINPILDTFWQKLKALGLLPEAKTGRDKAFHSLNAILSKQNAPGGAKTLQEGEELARRWFDYMAKIDRLPLADGDRIKWAISEIDLAISAAKRYGLEKSINALEWAINDTEFWASSLMSLRSLPQIMPKAEAS